MMMMMMVMMTTANGQGQAHLAPPNAPTVSSHRKQPNTPAKHASRKSWVWSKCPVFLGSPMPSSVNLSGVSEGDPPSSVTLQHGKKHQRFTASQSTVV